MKRIFIVLSLCLLMIFQVSAYFYYYNNNFIFFQNNFTKEVKYINIHTMYSSYPFNYYLKRYINGSEIGGKSKLTNWKIIRLEQEVHNHPEGIPPHIFIYHSGIIDTLGYSVSVNSEYSTGMLTNINIISKMSYSDLTFKEIFFGQFLMMFIDQFGLLFLLFLPLNIITFGLFGYIMYLLYKKFSINYFKYFYLNSFFSYLLFYLIIISTGFSAVEYSTMTGAFAQLDYIIVIFPKSILFFISLHYIKKFHIEHPDKKQPYVVVLWFYFLLFILFMIYLHILRPIFFGY